MKRKICLLHVYFGNLPVWFPFFIQSCKTNTDIDFIIFSDNNLSDIQTASSNIKFNKFTLQDFNLLASQKLNFKVTVEKPYKICDFKPAYGKIFENYLSGYDFWGYCDNDLIFGNLRSFITKELLRKFDFISLYKGFASGPLCLYRNNDDLKNLYRSIDNYENILLKTEYFGIDENVKRDALKGVSIIKLIKGIFFFIRNPAGILFLFKSHREIRYQFQWFIKKRSLKNKIPVDITEAIYQTEKEKKITPFFRELLLSDRHYKRHSKNKVKIFWRNGTLYDSEKKEIMGFHFVDSKLTPDFKVSKYISVNSFSISRYGIHYQ